MKIADIKNKDSNELEEIIKEHLVKLGKLSFERQSKTLKKSSEIGLLKREVARMRTIIKERLLTASH